MRFDFLMFLGLRLPVSGLFLFCFCVLLVSQATLFGVLVWATLFGVLV